MTKGVGSRAVEKNDMDCRCSITNNNNNKERNDSSGVETVRPSRRALHRRAVKKFTERRKNEEQKRLVEEQDGKLLHNNINNSRGGSVGRESTVSLSRSMMIVKWDFEFFFRKVPTDLLRPCVESMGPESAAPPPSSSSLYNEEEQSLLVLGDADTGDHSSPGASMSLKTLMQSNITKSIHVRRVEGVPPLPMQTPMQPGTDLDQPTWNYLLPDTTYNVHQHAPGFERDENAAKRSLLAAAVQEWRGRKEDVLVLSTGEALRSVFESTYCNEKPLALEVRRIGPTLLIGLHGGRDFRTRVRDMRERALMSKALYRIHNDALSRKEEDGQKKKFNNNNNNNNNNKASSSSNNGDGSDSSEDDDMTDSGGGVVALPTHRVGSLAISKELRTLSRYSHILSWEIGLMDVLVGMDTPIVLDRRDNMEYVLKLENTSVNTTPQEVQRDALRCWFDATLANVPQVGIYVHNDGIIQRYEVRKVQELLGIVEGSMATAAMNFTTNVLQWLVKQCGKDGMTYAVIRNYESGQLEIYEYSRDERLEKFLPEDAARGGREGRGSMDNYANDGSVDNKIGSDANKMEGDVETETTEEERRVEKEKEGLNWGLATMCFRMGMHLKDSVQKAPDAISLLLRSFALYFLQRTQMDEVCNNVYEIVKCLPALIGHLINNRKSALEEVGGIIQLPEIYREALLTCGRFEMRLQEAVYDETLNLPTRRALLRCILPCSAALCVCVARAMEQFFAERRVYMRLRAENSRGSNIHIHSLIAKDLLQVVVEGMLRLEQMNGILKCGTAAMRVAPLGENVVKPMAVMDPKREIIDVAPLEATIWELYTDIVLLVMSDQKSFTVDVLVELARRIKSREENRREKSDNLYNSNNNVVETGMESENTLAWLSSIEYDIVKLSLTAFRFITKVGVQSKRLLSKTAQVHYHVGCHYLSTDRYTKALDCLNRSQSLFKAVLQTSPNGVFGECCISAAMVTIRDVQQALGDVYIRMANPRGPITGGGTSSDNGSGRELGLALEQLLVMGGGVQTLSQKEEEFYRHALDFFTTCDAREKLADALIKYASRQIGQIASSGKQADVAKGRHIFSMLQKAEELIPNNVEVDWEVLRLCTCAAHHSALQRRVEQIIKQWRTTDASDTSTGAAIYMPLSLASSVHPMEFTLQMALVSISLLKAKKNAKAHQVMGLAREYAAYIVTALHDAHTASKTPGALLLRAMSAWRARCTHEWVYRISIIMSLRMMQVIVTLLPCGKTSEARQLLQQLTDLKEKGTEIQTDSELCADNCHFKRLSESLIEALGAVAKW